MRSIAILLFYFLAVHPAFGQGNSVFPVHNVTSGEHYGTISDAIDQANPGDHIELISYRFVEHVAIDIPLTLSGDANGNTVIDVSQQDGWGITLSSDGITLEDFSVVAGDVNTAYAVHSEPGITGLTIERVSVFDSNRSCIDLNGLTGPDINTFRDITVSGSNIGFGLAFSSCSNVLVENVTSVDNGFGDIAIMESNYSDEEIHDVVFAGYLDLEGPQSLGGGGVVVQVSPAEIPVGSGAGFPISMNAAGYDYLLEAPGDLTGCILVHNEDVREIAETLAANVAPLVSYDMVTQHMVVFPGMSVQSALDAAVDGSTIEVEAGQFEGAPVTISGDVTLTGANAGIDASDPRGAESVVGGFIVASGTPTIDGFRIAAEAGAGVEVADAAEGLSLTNTVITGNGTTSTQGIISRKTTSLSGVKVTGFAEAIRQYSGDFTLSEGLVQDNGTGLAVHHDAATDGATTLQSCTFENAGGKGVVFTGADAGDAFTMSASIFNLHGTSLETDAAIAADLTGNSFTNAESQTVGFGRETNIVLCGANTFEPALRITGCTDPDADNYEPCANIDQGCAYLGCTSPKACNFDSAANTDDGSCDFITCSACPLGFACNYDPDADLYRVEACDFAGCDGEGMAESGSGRAGLMAIAGCTIPQACNYDANADTDDGSCTFDCYGCLDGAACNYDAAFTQPSNETCLYISDLYPSPHVDCEGTCFNDVNANGVCDEEEVSGCMDFDACNFLAAATLDDASCDYASCAGCTNPAACNHDVDAVISDGSCDYESCSGCTEPDACNFDATALINDGSCTYPLDLHNKPYVNCDASCMNDADGDGICDEEETLGCTDDGACNYDASATDDDGSCDFDTCAGCTNPDYCNFNPGATLDNGSCATPEDLYPDAIVDGVSTVDCLGRCINDADGDGICDEAEIVCPGDLNGDGIRGATDILVMLSAFGCTADCGIADLNEDGIVAATDVLMALSTFGVACPQ